MNDKKLSQQLCDLREKLLEAENQRNSDAKTYSIEEVLLGLEKIINESNA